jgi:hypothetical protein
MKLQFLGLGLALVISYSKVNAQEFYHTIGGQYMQTTGAYGNYDRLSFQYAPQFHLEKKALIYAIAMPMTFGMVTSSARSDSKPVLEVPVMLELGYNPGAPCINYQSMSFFVGAGVSKQVLPELTGQQALFYNGVAGWRLMIRKVPFELRITGSRSFVNTSQIRLGFGIATEL